jgi:hypothetical protein
VLILATCREPAPPGDRSGELIRVLPADANTERAALTGLPPVAVAALLASAGRAASPEQAQAVHAETGGNPFLVRELARMRAEQPGAAPGTVPGAVLDVTSYRIAQLGPASQDVLRAAAVAGTSFSVGVVAQMLGTPALSVLDPVDEGQAAGFLVAGDRPGDYRFSHALVRSAVVAQLWPSSRTIGWRARCPATACALRGRARQRATWPRRTSRSRRPRGCTGRCCRSARARSPRPNATSSSWP